MPSGASRSRAVGLGALAALVLVACLPAAPSPPVSAGAPRLRYVALGDSYTIGTSVAERERWPNQLVERLPALELVSNLGVNGSTSRDVIDVQLPQLDALRPELISLLIGVNDVVQGVPADTYRANVVGILDDLVRRVGPARILVVTTPDYTVTPAGADYGDPASHAAKIRAWNAVNAELAEARGILVIDIYDLSLRAGTDRSLLASDGLHPSGTQYALWVDRIVTSVESMLGR